MMRELRASRPLDGDPDGLVCAFRGDPAGWLPDMTHAGNRPGRWLVYVWGGQIGVLVDLTVDRAVADGGSTWRPVTWEPVRWLGLRAPGFTGQISLHGAAGQPATLLLHGMYRPPGGLLGALADRVILHPVTRATARQLLADIAERLDRPERAGRRMG